MRFSFVLITKNEGATLPRLLDSLHDFMRVGGEVVVVDTGSTDTTVEIARTRGCKVEEVGDRFKHTVDRVQAEAVNAKFVVAGEQPVVSIGDTYFDFAAARNYAASLASNDMVFSVDADEVLKSLDFEAINREIENGATSFEYEFVYAHDDLGKPSIAFITSKSYDRTKMQWKGIIHETLQGETTKKVFLTKTQYGLEHFQNPATNRTGYLKGLAIDCFTNPDNDRNSHYLAREFMYHKRFKSAIQEFARHIAMDKWDAERAQSWIYMGDCFGFIGAEKESVDCYHQAFHVCTSKRESLLRLAYVYKRLNKPQAVAAYTEAAMTIPWSGRYMDNKSDYEDIPHALLYWAYGWLGNIPKAQEHIQMALIYQPHNETYLKDTAYYFDYKYPGIEGWMLWPELAWLNDMAKKMTSIAEVGSWKGRSTHALLSGCPGDVTAVDTWKGATDPKDGTYGQDVFREFLINTKDFENLIVNRNESVEAARRYKDGEFDMVFIDATHTHDEVKADIEAWLPKTKKLICGHDYSPQWPEVIKAVDGTLKIDGTIGTIWYKFIK
jgi:glycosyltransferase involved in cell wall biosynthesis